MVEVSNVIIRAAAKLYGEGDEEKENEFYRLYPEKQKPWIEDVQRVMPVISESIANFTVTHDPEKPNNYLHKREHLDDEIKARYVYPFL